MNTHTDGDKARDRRAVDVVVAGSGAAGLTAALAAARYGARVLVLEKAATIGGTTRKSAAWFWVPNNRLMREAGIEDSREDAIRYMARLSRPASFDPASCTYGLPAWEHEALGVFYDEGSSSLSALEDIGALELGGDPTFPDYYAHLDEDAVAAGRTMWPAEAGGAQAGGQMMIDRFLATARRLGVEVITDHAVRALIFDDNGVVNGVHAEATDGSSLHVHAQAAIFGTGGFTHDRELRQQHLRGPYVGGCASLGNTGDFLRIAQNAGAELANLANAWSAPIVLERLQRQPETAAGTFSMAGDAMILVDCEGKRVVNEKAPYNEIALAQLTWEPRGARYPYLPLIAIWDDVVAERFGGTDFGNPVPPPGSDAPWVASANHLDALADEIARRLGGLRSLTGGVTLDPGFVGRLRQTIERFNGYATRGIDEDFGRGETPIELAGAELMGKSAGPNPTMRAFASEGPYHATIFGPGTLDTKGGPRVDATGRVLRPDGTPIRGLYGAGNCVASPSGQGYWGGGGTIGPILCFAYLAGAHAARTAEAVPVG
jgi:succinate dehydrogenase/fumarate reductase flavoprotein subunit